jgi:hypothetical protein
MLQGYTNLKGNSDTQLRARNFLSETREKKGIEFFIILFTGSILKKEEEAYSQQNMSLNFLFSIQK